MNLQDRCAYFYELGLKLADLSRNNDLIDMLEKTLQARMSEIIARSAIHRSVDFNSFLDRLSNFEKELFSVKYATESEYRTWRNRRGNMLKQVDVTKKRKSLCL